MLRLERFCGGGSLSPRNDGPLMEAGRSAVAEGAGREAVTFWTGGAGDGAGVDRAMGGDVTGICAAAAAVWTGAVTCVGRSVAPHMPQKRLDSGFSLPQRGQRKRSS